MEREKVQKSKKTQLLWRILLALFGLAYFYAVAASFLVLENYVFCAVSIFGGIIIILDIILELLKVIFSPKSIKIIRYFEAVIFVGVGLAYLLYFIEII